MYDIWFVPKFPLDEINFSKRVHKEGSEVWRPALARNISEQGLVNPLIVLNHRPSAIYEGMWLKTGNNRLWALKYLGWTHAPVIITGVCKHVDRQLKTFEEANALFTDGELECLEEAHGAVLQLKNTSKPEEYEYPYG